MENNLENISLRAPKNEEEIDLIIKYWCEIFGDTRAFASDFYTWSGKENTLAAFSGEELLGAVNFPRVYFKKDGKVLSGGYIFGAFVRPEYRKKGVFSALMKGAETLMKDRGDDFSLVVPAGKELFSLYERFGYTTEVYNGFPYIAKREVLREYTPTDDIYVLWKVYSRAHDVFMKDMEFFNHTMRDAEENGKYFAVSKDGYIVYTPRHDDSVVVYDRMNGGAVLDGGKKYPRALLKMFDNGLDIGDMPVFNMLFEPCFEVLKI